MIVSIISTRCTTQFIREFALIARNVTVSRFRVHVCVDEFTDFLSLVYKTFAKLSRGSEGFIVKFPVFCEVKGRRFFVRVENGGLRYGEL